MLLAFLVIAVLALQIWSAARRIRTDFAARGERVEQVRWQPVRPLLEGRWTRHQMFFSVRYTDREGTLCTCRVIWTFFVGLTVEDERQVFTPTRSAVPRARTWSFPWFTVAGAAVGFVTIGLPYWAAQYNKLNLPDGLFGPGLILLGLLAGALQFTQPRRWLSTGLILPSAPIAVVIVRIAMDLGRDPTTHNLLPFEVAIAGFVGGVVVAAGMGCGALLLRVTASTATARR